MTKAGVVQHNSLYHCTEKYDCELSCGSSFASIRSQKWHMKRYCKYSKYKSTLIEREVQQGRDAKRKETKLKYKKAYDKKLADLKGSNQAADSLLVKPDFVLPN